MSNVTEIDSDEETLDIYDVRVRDSIRRRMIEAAEKSVVDARVKGDSPQKNMFLTLTGGILEYNDEENFEGAVQTEEGGHRKVMGAFVETEDLQGGTLSNKNRIFEDVRRRIDRIWDQPANEVLQKIALFWEDAQKACDFAEARSRILFSQLEYQPSSHESEQLEDLLENLRSSETPYTDSTITVVKESVSRCLETLEDSEQVSFDIQTPPNGHIVVEWNLEGRLLQWEIEPSAIPLPGLKARSVSIDFNGTRKNSSRLFFNIFDLVKDFQAS